MERGTKENPLIMQMIREVKPSELIFMTLVTLAPVAIALLMQKPGLRQAIEMRLFHTGVKISKKGELFWYKMGLRAQTYYDIAKL